MKTIKTVRQTGWIQICLMSILALTHTSAQGQSDANSVELIPLEDVRLELNFQDVPIQTVVEYLSEKAGLVIISDNGLDRRITVISRRFLNVDEAVGLLDSVLKDGGYTAIRQGRTLRIVSLNQAQYHPVPVVEGTDPEVITPGDTMEYRIIPIRFRDAVQLRDNLQPLIPEYAILQANAEGNVLMLMDTTANIKRILEIVRALDKPMSAVAQIQVFQLRNADAAGTAELINQLFEDQSQGSNGRNQRNAGGGRFGNPFQIFGRGGRGGRGGGVDGGGGNNGSGPNGNTDISTSGSERGYIPVNAAADDRTNSVVVSAPEERMTIIEEVIHGIDNRPAEIADVRVFHLEYADAQNTAELINDVFGLTGASRSQNQQQNNRQFGRGGGRGFPGFGGGNQNQQDEGTSSNVDVIAAADQRTNSVVVSGPPDTLDVIDTVIKELDANPEQERRIFPYALKNANATNLMTILNNLFAQMQDLTQQGTGRNNQRFQGADGGFTAQSGGGSDSTGLDEETFFEADPNTNTLLIMTSTKNYEKIKPIIDDLDKPVGQVLIKVLFAEVTHTNRVDLGSEFSALNLTGDNETTLSFGRQSPVSDIITTTTLTGNLNMTLDALQQTGRLNVLSRPYILTSNNQTATITVAQEIPIPTGSTTVAGQTQVTFDYRTDIGIVLEVTPSINPEGLVNMTITPKITTRTNETLTIAAGVDAEAFATRSATTKVAVLNGQTIVIGGLIEDQLNDTIKKVPLLGDLPLLGPLFRHKSNEKAKTELLIFLTPVVAAEAHQLVPISDMERKRSNIYTDESAAAVFQKHLEAMDNNEEENSKDPNDP